MFTLLNLLLAVFFGGVTIGFALLVRVPKIIAALLGLAVGIAAYLANFAVEVL